MALIKSVIPRSWATSEGILGKHISGGPASYSTESAKERLIQSGTDLIESGAVDGLAVLCSWKDIGIT